MTGERMREDRERPPWTTPAIPPLTTRITTARLAMRPPRATDVAELRAHLRRSAAHLRPWSPAPQGAEDVTSITTLSRVVARQRREWRRGSAFALLLTSREDERRVVGRVTLGTVVRSVFQNAYLGYEIDADEVGKGYATEAVAAALAFAFGACQLHRVQAAVMPSNTRSVRVVEKLGFRREGLAERYLCIAGAWEDHVLYARTFDEG